MQSRVIAVLSLVALVSAGCGSGGDSDRAVPTGPPPTNEDGSPVTDIFTANFDPAGGVLPFPNNLLLQGTTDLTLNIPVADPNDYADPPVALNALDGFSTTSPTTTTFSGRIDPESVVPGSSVRLFKVNRSPAGAVTGVVNELVPGVDFTATVAASDSDGKTLAVVPLPAWYTSRPCRCWGRPWRSSRKAGSSIGVSRAMLGLSGLMREKPQRLASNLSSISCSRAITGAGRAP